MGSSFHWADALDAMVELIKDEVKSNIDRMAQDIIAMQEIIWETKPDLIVETGIVHGGSDI